MKICLTKEELDNHKGHCVLASDLGWPDEGAYFANLKVFLDRPHTLKYVTNTVGPGQAIINAVSTVIVRSWGHWADSEMGMRHIFSNLRKISESPTIKLEDCPGAIWCASGPSLDTNLELVKKASKGNWLITCPDASLKTLLDAGITPHIVFSTERGIETRDLLLRAIKGKEDMLKDTWLNSSIYLHPDSLGAWPGPVTFHFRKQAEVFFLFPALSDRLEEILTQIPHVAAPSLDWLLKRGVKELVLVGQDLCYADSGATHTSTHKDEWLESLERYACDLNDGSKGFTNSYWAEWALDLSNIFLSYQDKARIYNTSLKGVRLQGTLIPKDLEDFGLWIERQKASPRIKVDLPVPHRPHKEMIEELKRYQPDIVTDLSGFWKNKAALFLGFPIMVRDFCLFQVRNYAAELEGKKPQSLKELKAKFRKMKALLLEILTASAKGEKLIE